MPEYTIIFYVKAPDGAWVQEIDLFEEVKLPSGRINVLNWNGPEKVTIEARTKKSAISRFKSEMKKDGWVPKEYKIVEVSQ